MKRLAVTAEDIPHGFGGNKDNELAIHREFDKKRITISARSLFQKFEWRIGVAQQLPKGRGAETGRQRSLFRNGLSSAYKNASPRMRFEIVPSILLKRRRFSACTW